MRLSFLFFIFLFFSACQQNFQEPAIDLSAYQIEEGFELEVIASEPLIEAPVVMQFDENGRMWVLEMQGYMQNIDGTPGLVTKEKAELGKLPTDVWWHTIVSPTGKEKTGYPTQKPEGILRRIIQASSRESDRVLDFFAGSGTTGAVAGELGRRFTLIDSSKDAINTITKRLSARRLEFEILER